MHARAYVGVLCARALGMRTCWTNACLEKVCRATVGHTNDWGQLDWGTWPSCVCHTHTHVTCMGCGVGPVHWAHWTRTTAAFDLTSRFTTEVCKSVATNLVMPAVLVHQLGPRAHVGVRAAARVF